jgi:mRNA interferase MazF
MPTAKPGEIWRVDLGMTAKVRPCLILTRQPGSNELDVFTIVAHTTSLHGNCWEIPIPKPFLDIEGAFDVQRIATVASVKLEHRLGELKPAEFEKVLNLLAERLDI